MLTILLEKYFSLRRSSCPQGLDGRSFGEDYLSLSIDMRLVWFDIKPTIRSNFKKLINMSSLSAKRFFFTIIFIFLAATLFLFNPLTQTIKKSVNDDSVSPIVSDNTSSNKPFDAPIINDDLLNNNSISVSSADENNAVSNKPIVIGRPVKFAIPSINVSANIEKIGLNENGAVGAPEGAFDVSWFDLGPRPGENGNALISGHSGIWKDGSHSIFDNLHTLKPGDIVYVSDDNGTDRSFIVQEMRVYDKNETVPELFASSDNAGLNIITCHGDWIKSEKTYSKRLVVFTQMQKTQN